MRTYENIQIWRSLSIYLVKKKKIKINTKYKGAEGADHRRSQQGEAVIKLLNH